MTTWYETNYPDSKLSDWPQATVAEANTYHLARGNTDWTGTDEVKTQALQRTWDYLNSLTYQDNVFDTELPEKIKDAQIVGAWEELKSQGVLQPIISSEDFLVKKNIANTIIKEYKQGAPSQKRFTEMDALLKPFLRNTSPYCVQAQRG